jgi:hypothetical protein
VDNIAEHGFEDVSRRGLGGAGEIFGIYIIHHTPRHPLRPHPYHIIYIKSRTKYPLTIYLVRHDSKI